MELQQSFLVVTVSFTQGSSLNFLFSLIVVRTFACNQLSRPADDVESYLGPGSILPIATLDSSTQEN
jgi:hypothetical protein